MVISEKNSSTFKYISDLFKYNTALKKNKNFKFSSNTHFFLQYIPVLPVQVATMSVCQITDADLGQVNI